MKVQTGPRGFAHRSRFVLANGVASLLDSLSDKLTGIFQRLSGRGVLTDELVGEALREVRVALLEADVALPVVRDFVAGVRERAVGQAVVKAVAPAQQVIKIVHDALVALLGDGAVPLNLNVAPPAVILLAGLQGAGKTTTAGKLARFLTAQKKRVLLASLDIYRPAAQAQLALLAPQAGAISLEIVAGEAPVAIATRALQAARREGYDVLILDTAGRTTADAAMMAEIQAVATAVPPAETLLVLDAMTGQDAVATAQAFGTALAVTGTILTRIDGDARGGAALSLRAVTGQPIKFLGTGEKLDGLEVFHPDRLAGRILGMGDVVSLVESAIGKIDQDAAAKAAKRAAAGKFDFNDLSAQLGQRDSVGGLGGMLNVLPGAGQLEQALASSKVDDKTLGRQRAIIGSMTAKERATPNLLNGPRRRRIASGAGVTVEDVNRLVKQYQQMADMMKLLKQGGPKGLMRAMGGKLPSMGNMLGGGLSNGLPPELQAQLDQLKTKPT